MWIVDEGLMELEGLNASDELGKRLQYRCFEVPMKCTLEFCHIKPKMRMTYFVNIRGQHILNHPPTLK